jgi:hypothetical protein
VAIVLKISESPFAIIIHLHPVKFVGEDITIIIQILTIESEMGVIFYFLVLCCVQLCVCSNSDKM